jgi:hypothetical protein
MSSRFAEQPPAGVEGALPMDVKLDRFGATLPAG